VRSEALALDHGVKAMSFTTHALRAAPDQLEGVKYLELLRSVAFMEAYNE
jgi:hypothetical protein